MAMQVQIDWLFFSYVYMHMHKHAHLRAAVSSLVQSGYFFCLVSTKHPQTRSKQSGVWEPLSSIQCPGSFPEKWVMNTLDLLAVKETRTFQGVFCWVKGSRDWLSPFGEILVISLSLPSCTVLGFLFCVRQEES